MGIARCLYKDAEVLILDEATSGLFKTEENLINSLNNLTNPLLFVIAHR